MHSNEKTHRVLGMQMLLLAHSALFADTIIRAVPTTTDSTTSRSRSTHHNTGGVIALVGMTPTCPQTHQHAHAQLVLAHTWTHVHTQAW